MLETIHSVYFSGILNMLFYAVVDKAYITAVLHCICIPVLSEQYCL